MARVSGNSRRCVRRALSSPVILGSLLSLYAAMPAWAQAEDDDDHKAPDILVVATKQNQNNTTGTKSDTPLIETPQSISVVTSDQLDTIKTTTLSDALNYMPGLLPQPSSNARYADQVTIRGFLADPATGNFLRDGLKLQSNLYDGGQEPYGLERVEVLRGASSVLYGLAAPGGVVNTFTKRGPTSPVYELNLEYGSFDRKQVTADVGGPIGGGFSARLTGLYRDSDTNVDYIPDNRRFIAPVITFRSAGTEISLLGNYQQIRTKFSAPLPLVGTLVAPPNGVRISRDLFIGEPSFDRFTSDSGTVGAQFDHEFNDHIRVHSGFRYYHSRIHMDYPVPGAIVGDSIVRTPSPRTNTSTGLTSDTNFNLKFGSEDFQNTVTVGLDYYHREYAFHRFGGPTELWNYVRPTYGRSFTIGTTDIGSEENGDQLGIYFQDHIKLWKRLVILAGGRRDWVDNRTRVYSTRALTFAHDSAWTGRVGAVYLFDGGIAPYASYSQSFQPQSGVDRLGQVFVPTRGDQYEAGIRYIPPGKATTISGAVYQLTQRNVVTPDPENVSYSIQTGEVRSRGVELEAKTLIGGVFNLITSYTYTDAVATKTNIPAQLNQRVASAPEHTASLWADYDFRKVGIEGLRLGSAVRYIGSTNLPGLTFDVPGYTLVDLYGSYEFGRFRVAINAKNVADKIYYYCNTTTSCRYGDPRMIVGTLSFRY
ncbi:TonB-dependent siderophore receptor [Sphingomonas sp. DT-204]|uniref:TonB-dependent siderophore receptor n=1 Tax=Sphingomonas sp. DT-204 TaxID=3396166 RepID=UPI003F1B84E1